jgi:hypothetical protein
VEVFRADGRLLTSGKLDKNGVFIFSFAEVQTLKVVVTSVGHRAETAVAAEALARATINTCVASLPPQPTPFLAAALLSPLSGEKNQAERTVSYSDPRADRGSTFPVGGALLGLAILFTIAAISRWRTSCMRRQQAGQKSTSNPAARK